MLEQQLCHLQVAVGCEVALVREGFRVALLEKALHIDNELARPLPEAKKSFVVTRHLSTPVVFDPFHSLGPFAVRPRQVHHAGPMCLGLTKAFHVSHVVFERNAVAHNGVR